LERIVMADMDEARARVASALLALDAVRAVELERKVKPVCRCRPRLLPPIISRAQSSGASSVGQVNTPQGKR
jgi:hypothetical protein